MKLSIVIPSFCADKHLAKCMDSIAAQNDPDTEVIIVDCSPNDAVEQIAANYSFVKFYKEKQRFNPGIGRNIGASYASGEYIVFIDADVELKSDALANIKKHAATEKRIFGAALELNTDAVDDFAAKVEHYFFNHESQSSRPPSIRSNLSSAFMVMEKALFLSYGGFADIARMQDTELTERMRADGVQLHFCPDIIAYQIQDSPLHKVLKKIKINGNNLYFIRYQKNMTSLKKLALLLALPLLMLVKITRINARNLKYKFGLEMLLVYCPYMYICGLYWLAGFYGGVIGNKGISSGR